MHGYEPSTYGDRFADIYDDWYPEHDTTAATLAALMDWTEPGDRVIELGVGTGRLAIPLAGSAREVWGIDASATMIERLRAKPGGEAVHAIVGDLGDDLPDGRFALVYVTANTFFGLPSAEAQQRCFERVADRLTEDGRFVIEAFVPAEPVATDDGGADNDTDERRGRVEVRSMTADCVVLSISRADRGDQRAEGHHVELRHGAPVILRPWSVRYATPGQLDGFADAAGLSLASRWADWSAGPFDEASAHHVSAYRRVPAPSVTQ